MEFAEENKKNRTVRLYLKSIMDDGIKKNKEKNMSYMGFNCAKSAEIISFSSFCFCCCLCVCAFAIMSYTSKTLGNIDDKTKSPSPFIFLHKITNKFKHHLVTFLHEDRKRALTWVQRDHRHKTTERERDSHGRKIRPTSV